MQNINKVFNNADSFAMAFDEAWERTKLISNKELKKDEKIKKALELVKDHPFMEASYQEAEKVAKFRVRLLNLK
tara:strand:- start:82 stop:303 length:222 start_codon:yes stop_codon:yes gene_type:complete